MPPALDQSRLVRRPALAAGLCLVVPMLAAAQPAPTPPVSARPVGRISFYTSAFRIAPDDSAAVSSADFITAVQLATPETERNGLEYGVDMRNTQSTGTSRPARLSMYDGYVGARLGHGRARIRAGQMWLTDLGGLGAVTGGHVEVRQALDESGRTRLKVGGFAGVEPDPFGLGHAAGVRKLGAYATLDAPGGRRHTAGYIRVSQGGLTERSVLTTSNFIRGGTRLFVFQTAELDLAGPGGQGHGRLTYFMTNVHGSVSDSVDVQGLYHRGRSVDARAITDDVLNSRPVTPDALSGLLFESAGLRLTVRAHRAVRLHAGYTRDRNNMDSTATGRLTTGASLTNLAGAGVDLTVSLSRLHRPSGQYHSSYLSAGRQIGPKVYVTGEYSSSVSIARFTRSDGVTIESKPHTRQIAGSGTVTLTRSLSMLVTVDRTRDDAATDLRVLAGLSVRVR